MEVIYKYGDSITIPDGCKVSIKYGCVVFEKEQSFKDGDILVSVEKNFRRNAFIYKNTADEGFHSYYIGLDACGQLSSCEKPTNRWGNDELSYATEEEKQLLFDKMKKRNLRWNAEKKQVENIRWRADIGEYYYFIATTGLICEAESKKEELYTDNYRYSFFNQFRTEKQAQEAAKRVKETLKNYHNEIGE